eukprot:Awhi_evm2s910
MYRKSYSLCIYSYFRFHQQIKRKVQHQTSTALLKCRREKNHITKCYSQLQCFCQITNSTSATNTKSFDTNTNLSNPVAPTVHNLPPTTVFWFSVLFTLWKKYVLLWNQRFYLKCKIEYKITQYATQKITNTSFPVEFRRSFSTSINSRALSSRKYLLSFTPSYLNSSSSFSPVFSSSTSSMPSYSTSVLSKSQSSSSPQSFTKSKLTNSTRSFDRVREIAAAESAENIENASSKIRTVRKQPSYENKSSSISPSSSSPPSSPSSSSSSSSSTTATTAASFDLSTSASPKKSLDVQRSIDGLEYDTIEAVEKIKIPFPKIATEHQSLHTFADETHMTTSRPSTTSKEPQELSKKILALLKSKDQGEYFKTLVQNEHGHVVKKTNYISENPVPQIANSPSSPSSSNSHNSWSKSRILSKKEQKLPSPKNIHPRNPSLNNFKWSQEINRIIESLPSLKGLPSSIMNANEISQNYDNEITKVTLPITHFIPKPKYGSTLSSSSPTSSPSSMSSSPISYKQYQEEINASISRKLEKFTLPTERAQQKFYPFFPSYSRLPKGNQKTASIKNIFLERTKNRLNHNDQPRPNESLSSISSISSSSSSSTPQSQNVSLSSPTLSALQHSSCDSILVEMDGFPNSSIPAAAEFLTERRPLEKMAVFCRFLAGTEKKQNVANSQVLEHQKVNADIAFEIEKCHE